MTRRDAGGRCLLGLAAAVGVALTALSGCASEPPPPASDPELREALGIADDVTIHRVDLAASEVPSVRPDSLIVQRGDVVQFIVLDHQVHLIRFLEDRIAPDLLDFLRNTAQDQPPPLVEQGARLVLSFQEAPPGAYPFQVLSNGPPTPGRIQVVAP